MSEGILGQVEGSEMSSRSNGKITTRGEMVRVKSYRSMEIFVAEGGSCSYDDERIYDIGAPLRYRHIVK